MIVGSGRRDRRAKAAVDSLRAAPTRALARAGLRRAVLYERPLGRSAERDDDALSHHWLGADEIPRLAAAAERDARAQLRRLARGARCFATTLEGRIVAFRWVVASGAVEVDFLRVGLRLPVTEA